MSSPAAGVKVHPLVALCSQLLAEFATGENGHPGRPARRSRWVDVAQLEAWQDRLAELALHKAGTQRDTELDDEIEQILDRYIRDTLWRVQARNEICAAIGARGYDVYARPVVSSEAVSGG